MPSEIFEKLMEAMENDRYAITGGDRKTAVKKLFNADKTLLAYPRRRGKKAFRQKLEKAANLPLTSHEPDDKTAWEKTLPAVRFVNALCTRYNIDYAIPENPEEVAKILTVIRNIRFNTVMTERAAAN